MLRRPDVLQNCCQRTAALNKELQQLLAEAEPLVADADAAASVTDSQAKKDADDPWGRGLAHSAAPDRTVPSPNGDDALAERTTIPCDLCGEAVPLSSFLHHVQVSHGINLNAVVDVTPDCQVTRQAGVRRRLAGRRGGARPRLRLADAFSHRSCR